MIFYSLFYMLQEKELKEYSLLRVTIREDEEFGEAIIELPNGTPQTWEWDKENDIWR